MPDALTGALRHGYTIADLRALARRAAGDGDQDAVEAAYSGIAEALYAAATRPGVEDLVHAGRDAIDPVAPHRDTTALDMVTDPERQVVETQALHQIWPTLTATQRRCLRALAEAGDPHRAATALGMTGRRFADHVRAARRRFLALWHEGETPVDEHPGAPARRPRDTGASAGRLRHTTALRAVS
jgi:hypothetical protein